MGKRYKTDFFDGIKIVGSKIFIEHTKKALRLLKKKTPGTYRTLVLKHLRCIRYARVSQVNDAGEFRVSNITAYPDLAWYASCIVHDAYHVELKARGLVNSGTSAELKCIKMQIRAGLRIGLSNKWIEHLKTEDGTHWKSSTRG